MHLQSPNFEPDTPADLFTSRYNWLLRWAMHFAHNDRAVAEDLMQDTFLRFSQANVTVTEIRDVEALLYTYLEHVHLAHMRELIRHSFVSLSDAQLDALALKVVTGPDVERVESQNVLRRIASFISWRKQTSKAASIVALRFFHGYLPEEIARIALMSREAVDERLHHGRNEIRLYLLDATKLREIQRGGPAEIFPSKVAVPTEELLIELRNQLFLAAQTACLSPDQLLLRYRKAPDEPISRQLLSHIVSCSKCLSLVDQIFIRNQPPRNRGRLSSLITMGNRSSNQGAPATTDQIQTTISRAELRRKQIFEHRPIALIVAVNGEILASRDIRASSNRLNVEVPTNDLKFIDVLNEYGLPLFSWAATSTSPHDAPVIHRMVGFSAERWLGVDLHFFAPKLVIEVEYHDSSYHETILPSFAVIAPDEDNNETDLYSHESHFSWISAQWELVFHGLSRFQPTPLGLTATVCTILVPGALLFGWRNSSPIRPSELMRQATFFERSRLDGLQSSVILQEVSMRSNRLTFQRSIYRDTSGKHHPKELPLDHSKARLRKHLEEAGISWDAPLSASSFEVWQSHARIKSESVHKIDDQFLKLQVDTDGSDVEQETLTIRALDLHPVERTIQFRDAETVEIAELNYAVIPWQMMNQDLFVSDDAPSVSSGAVVPMSRSNPLQPISEAELDLTELQVRTLLHDLHADITDRLDIQRSVSGIQVKGLVENDAQKLDIKHRLELIPHVSAKLTTIANATLHSENTPPPTSVQTSSVVAGPSVLESFLLNQGKSRDFSNEITSDFFSGSVAILRSIKALDQLNERFAPEKLSGDSLDLYNHLLASWYDELSTALSKESETIQRTGALLNTYDTKPEPAELHGALQHNQRLLKELIGHDEADPRTAPVVLSDLTRSVESMRKAARAERERVSRTTLIDIPSDIENHP